MTDQGIEDLISRNLRFQNSANGTAWAILLNVLQ